MIQPLEVGDVHVWLRRTDGVDDLACAESLRALSPDEQARAARFMFFPDRVAFACAHALLRETLSRYATAPSAGWQFTRTAAGKPMLADPEAGLGLRFNLTHTHGLVACAISRQADVGIDAEPVRQRVEVLDVARRFFSPTEAAAIAAAPVAERLVRFIELWTLKEAFVKAIGQGLSYPLHTFSFGIGAGATVLFDPPPGESADDWQFAVCDPTGGHRLTLAVRRDAGVPVRLSVWADGIASATPHLYTGPSQSSCWRTT